MQYYYEEDGYIPVFEKPVYADLTSSFPSLNVSDDIKHWTFSNSMMVQDHSYLSKLMDTEEPTSADEISFDESEMPTTLQLISQQEGDVPLQQYEEDQHSMMMMVQEEAEETRTTYFENLPELKRPNSQTYCKPAVMFAASQFLPVGETFKASLSSYTPFINKPGSQPSPSSFEWEQNNGDDTIQTSHYKGDRKRWFPIVLNGLVPYDTESITITYFVYPSKETMDGGAFLSLNDEEAKLVPLCDKVKIGLPKSNTTNNHDDMTNTLATNLTSTCSNTSNNTCNLYSVSIDVTLGNLQTQELVSCLHLEYESPLSNQRFSVLLPPFVPVTRRNAKDKCYLVHLIKHLGIRTPDDLISVAAYKSAVYSIPGLARRDPLPALTNHELCYLLDWNPSKKNANNDTLFDFNMLCWKEVLLLSWRLRLWIYRLSTRGHHTKLIQNARHVSDYLDEIYASSPKRFKRGASTSASHSMMNDETTSEDDSYDSTMDAEYFESHMVEPSQDPSYIPSNSRGIKRVLRTKRSPGGSSKTTQKKPLETGSPFPFQTKQVSPSSDLYDSMMSTSSVSTPKAIPPIPVQFSYDNY